LKPNSHITKQISFEFYYALDFEIMYFYGFLKLHITRWNRTDEEHAFVSTMISNFGVLRVQEIVEVRASLERKDLLWDWIVRVPSHVSQRRNGSSSYCTIDIS